MGSSAQLKLSEVRAVFRLLGDLRDLRSDPQRQQQRLVSGVAALIGADVSHTYSFADWRIDAVPRCTAMTVPADADAQVVATLARWSGEFDVRGDPFWAGTVATPARTAPIALGEVLPEHDRRRFSSFADLIGTLRIQDILAGYFHHGPDAITGVSLHLCGARRTFNARQRRVFALFIQEWERAYRAGQLEAPPDPAAGLTPRQHEIFDALLRGESPKEIAFGLGLSVHTVREHMTLIYQRFGVSTRDQLMAAVIRHLRRRG